MQRYIARRVLQSFLAIWVMSLIVFSLARLSGNALDVMLPMESTQEDYDRLAKYWGLDQPLHVQSAVKKGTVWDSGAKVIALLGQSLPGFWLGIVLMWIFAVHLGWLPTSGRGGLQYMILPAITLGWFQVAAIMRLVRSSMLDVLDTEFVKLTRIKGLAEWKVVWKHCLRNASIAPLTFFAIIAGVLMTGSVVTESVFSWPGT